MSPLIPLTEPMKGEYVVKIHFAKKKFPQSISLHSSSLWGTGVYEMVWGFFTFKNQAQQIHANP